MNPVEIEDLVHRLVRAIDRDEPPGLAAHKLARSIVACVHQIEPVDAIFMSRMFDRLARVRDPELLLEEIRAESSAIPREEFGIGDRVFHRRADLFGSFQGYEEENGTRFAFVRYEWPHDGKQLTRVPYAELKRG